MLLCERFGYDADRIEQQLRLVGLTPTDHKLVERLHREIVQPHARAIVARFYGTLKRDQRFWEVMSRGFSLPRLHRAQVAALGSMGRDFDTQGYFERRLRIGVAHARAKVPLELYVGAYRVLTQAVLDQVPERSPDASDYRALVLKLILLDVSIVSGTYHRVDMEELQTMLASTRDEAERQRERARRDSLTAIYNRDHVVEVLDTAFEAARQQSRSIAVAMLDLDDLKPINDTHGHLVGDEVLREVTSRLRAEIRDGDTLGRYGGDEFLLVLEGVHPPEAHDIVDRLRERVSQQPLVVGDVSLTVTLSAGLACLEDDADFAALLRRADDALYIAKAEGRNRVWFGSRRPRGRAVTMQAPAASEDIGSTG